ncbi:MAG: hypothetical protein H6Q90_4718 [Deltaproteobacteria bacterium]|nr:hypothetical protein [Deltaproteobacteria bacterium]
MRRVSWAAVVVGAWLGCGDNQDPGPGPALDSTIVPLETADATALLRMADWRRLPTLGDGHYLQAASTDRGTNPPAALPYPLFSNGNSDFSNFLCASEDAQIGKPTLVEPKLALLACAEPYVHGFVLGRFEGSGVLARLWMTTFNWHNSPPSDEILRIYIDDGEVPAVQVPLADVLTGTAGEMFAPPFGAGAANYVATYYPIVFATKLIVAIDRIQPVDVVFYQVDAVVDAASAPRHAPAARLAERDAAISTLAALADGPVTGSVLKAPTPFTVAPSTSQVVAQLTGPATIHTFRVKLAATSLARAHDVLLEARWDNAVPAISLPLTSLFAAIRDAPDNASLALHGASSAGDVTLELRLPMPFTSAAEWTVRNTGAQPITLEISIDGEAALPPEPWGTLHAQTHETLPPASTHPLAHVAGRGRLVGVCAALEGHALAAGGLGAASLNFLEGDERATIDGVLAIQGTGTEDYFNSGWYFDHGTSSNAFAQAWSVEGAAVGVAAGAASACRWHVGNDAIDFHSGLDLELEIGPGDPSVLERYRSVAFYYQRDPS